MIHNYPDVQMRISKSQLPDLQQRCIKSIEARLKRLSLLALTYPNLEMCISQSNMQHDAAYSEVSNE